MFQRNLKRFDLLRPKISPVSSTPVGLFPILTRYFCHYKILGVNPDASTEEIKNAYYQQARLFHPDTNQGKNAEETFKKIKAAYEILKDPALRQNYDLQKFEASIHDDLKNYRYDHSSSSQTATSEGRDEMEVGEGSSTEKNRAPYKVEVLLTQICLALALVLAIDIWRREKAKEKEKEKEKKSKVIDSESQITAVGPLVFESPLVFVRDKPIDPVKLQEEMKKKQFRIEYEAPKSKYPDLTKKGTKKTVEPKIVSLEEYMDLRTDKV